MKIIVLGDLHGNSIWKEIIQKEESFDKVVFIGDYFDSRTISTDVQIQNFIDVVEFKKQHSERIILLTGNHDIHYFPEIGDCNISKYQADRARDLEAVVRENKKHLQVAYQYGKFLFSHAGVSSVYMNNVFGMDNWAFYEIAELLNELFVTNPRKFLFNGIDPTGNDIYQTPFWIRPESLLKSNRNTLEEKVVQVFGHTKIESILDFSSIMKDRYFLVDTLNTSGEYLIIENGVIDVRKV